MKRSLNKLKNKNKILKKENAALRMITEEMVNKDTFLKCCEKYLSPQAALFMKEQIFNEYRKTNGRRYSLKFRRLCLNLYFKGPRAYRALQSIFSLPSKATLNRLTANISITSGINESIFHLLSVKTVNMTDSEKYCMVCFDEMAIKCNLFYNTKNDEIIGFHDNGETKEFKPAKLACVFLARGIFSNWKQPLAYEFSYTACSSTNLYKLLKLCISSLQNIGLKVVIVVCDMGSSNKYLANNLGITYHNPYFIVNNQQIFFTFDVPHLIKATRNMFLKHDFKYDRYIAKIEYLKKFYEIDSTKKFRLASKLTSTHINPGPLEKMKTVRATQLFSQMVVTGLSTYIHFEKISADAIGTVNFIDKMDKLFDMLNSTGKYKGNKVHAHAFEGNDLQVSFLQECLEFFNSLTIINSNGINVTNNMKFIEGWKVTISAVMQLWNYLNGIGFKFLETRRLNQDVIENLFGHLLDPKEGIV